MIFKFRIISDENETFLRTIEISEKDTFLSLNEAILKACKYESSQMTSFFVSNNDWEKVQEITLVDMNDESTHTVPMEKAILNKYINKVDDKLIFMFDFFGDRALFCTLMEIKDEERKIKYPICSHSAGNPPIQVITEEDEFSELFNEFEYDDEDSDLDLDDESKSEFNEFDEFGGEEFNEKDF